MKANHDQLLELLSAYLDGELTAKEAGQVERLLREDEEARQLLDELRRTVDLVSTLPRHAAPPSIADNVRAHLERADLLGDPDKLSPTSRPRPSPIPTLVLLAAMVMLVVLPVGIWMVGGRDKGASEPGSNVVARNTGESEEDMLRGRLGEDGLVAERSARDRNAPLKSDDVGRSKKRARAGRHRAKGLAPSVGATGESDSWRTEKALSPDERTTKGSPRRKSTASDLDIGKRSSLEAQSAVSIASFTNETLFARATIEQKLTADTDIQLVRAHPFANEETFLRVTARSAAERDALAAKLLAGLREAGAVNLGSQDDQARVSRLGSSPFYFRGQPDTNFEGDEQTQVLARVDRAALKRFLAEIDESGIADNRVAFRAGPVRVRGLRNSVAALSPAQETRSRQTPRLVDRDQVDRQADEAPAVALTEPASFVEELIQAFTTAPAASAGGDEQSASDQSIFGADVDASVAGGRGGDPESDEPVVAEGAKADDSERHFRTTPAGRVAGKATPSKGVAEIEAEETSPAPVRPSSLVDRRLKELQAAREATAPSPAAETGMPGLDVPESAGTVAEASADDGDSDEAADGQYVTLVFQLKADKPKPDKASTKHRSNARPKSDAGMKKQRNSGQRQ